jgi:hypothetical protein
MVGQAVRKCLYHTLLECSAEEVQLVQNGRWAVWWGCWGESDVGKRATRGVARNRGGDGRDRGRRSKRREKVVAGGERLEGGKTVGLREEEGGRGQR